MVQMSGALTVGECRLCLTAKDVDLTCRGVQHWSASERQLQMEIEIAEGIGSLLIIEDEGLVSMMIEDMVRQLGASDVRVCMDLETAAKEAETGELDCAVLDVRVRGGDTAPIADIL